MAQDFQKKKTTTAAQEASVRSSFRDYDPNNEMRMVLIGKTGNGKSSSGNTILSQRAFTSCLSPSSVTSHCEKARGVVCGCRVAVIDTPGIYDTRYKEDKVLRKLKECVSLSAPGPHVFLIVIKLDKFTEEEQKTVKLLQDVFGTRAADYSLVLFTHGELLGHTTIEKFFSKSKPLSSLVANCNRRYHVFSNTISNNTQVRELLAKIRHMIRSNGGRFYTNEMFQRAERLIQEQAEKNLKEKTEKKRKEEERLRAMYKGKELQEKLRLLDQEYKTKSRDNAEKKNKFIETGMILPAAEACASIGIAAAAAGGPICMGVGAVVGGIAGAVLGVLTPAAVRALRGICAVQ